MQLICVLTGYRPRNRRKRCMAIRSNRIGPARNRWRNANLAAFSPAHTHFASGGRLISTASALWPVSSPNFVPRS